MKKIISLLLTTFIAIQLFSQDIFVTQGLSQDQKVQVQKAKKDIDRANRIFSNAQNVYNQYKNLLESPKKGKRKKGEKKTIPAKKNVQQAVVYYQRGFKTLFEVYYNYVGGLKYQLPENQQKAEELRSQAEAEYTAAVKIFNSIKNIPEKELKNTRFKDIISRTQSAYNKAYKSAQLLVQAINMFNNETQQIQEKRRKDDQAWQKALAQNTIEAYEQYLAQFPDGRHVSEAKAKIEELKNQQNANQDTNYLYYQVTPSQNLIYRVQILADKKPWTPEKIRQKIYSLYGKDGNPTFSAVIDGWFKYYVGEFKTYQQAKNLANNLKVSVKTKPFVVAFLNDEPIDIKQALAIEKGQ